MLANYLKLNPIAVTMMAWSVYHVGNLMVLIVGVVFSHKDMTVYGVPTLLSFSNFDCT